MEQIITSLQNIENLISNLTIELEKICEQYSSKLKSYPQLMEPVSEKIYESLHEINNDIGFLRNDIELLKKYIEFREAFELFTNEELLILIDNENITSENKNQMAKKKDISHVDLLKQIDLVKRQWNKEFNNINYQKILQRLNIGL